MTGQELRLAMLLKGYSQRGFSGRIGVNERTVRRWVLGEIEIPRWAVILVEMIPPIWEAEAPPPDAA